MDVYSRQTERGKHTRITLREDTQIYWQTEPGAVQQLCLRWQKLVSSTAQNWNLQFPSCSWVQQPLLDVCSPWLFGRVPAPIFLLQATAVLVGRSPNPAHPQIWAHQVLLATTPAEPDQKNPHLLGMRRERVWLLIFISNKTRSSSSWFVISQIKCFATYKNNLISGSHN